MAAIIFDFDGTIADSFDFVADFLADEKGRQHLSELEKQSLRGLSMFAMARRLGHPWWRLLRLLFRGRERMGSVISRIEPFPSIPELVEKLHSEGHELFILTSNTVPNVHKFLHHHKLHTFFLEVYGGIGLFGKARGLRRLLREQQLEPQACVYIGDELRDVQAAQTAGVRVVAVTWGFARPSDLEAQKPTALAHTVDDLMKILEDC
ncbi:MAG TPA: HAD-IA family hydrolase [Candidatus Saccharimonadales bacterium]|nr:HAD-IA family hydrolase [Candidatus Saccharimonadales bacterium]